MFMKPNTSSSVRKFIGGANSTLYGLADGTSSTVPSLVTLATSTFPTGYTLSGDNSVSFERVYGVLRKFDTYAPNNQPMYLYGLARMLDVNKGVWQTELINHPSTTTPASVAMDSKGNIVMMFRASGLVTKVYFWPVGSSVVEVVLPQSVKDWRYSTFANPSIYFNGSTVVIGTPPGSSTIINQHFTVSEAGVPSELIMTAPTTTSLRNPNLMLHPTVSYVTPTIQMGTVTDASDGWSSTYWMLVTTTKRKDGTTTTIQHQSLPNATNRTTQPIWKDIARIIWLDGYWYGFGVNGTEYTCYRTKVDITTTKTVKTDWVAVPSMSGQSFYNGGLTILNP